MEATLDRKKRQFEERKRAWEERFEVQKQEEYEKVYRQYPELMYDEIAMKAAEDEKQHQ